MKRRGFVCVAFLAGISATGLPKLAEALPLTTSERVLARCTRAALMATR
jgi:hypothetical protein